MRLTTMRCARLTLPFIAALVLAPSCYATDDPVHDGSDSPGGKADDLDEVVDADFGLDSRPGSHGCVAPARPSSASSVATTRAFPNLSFSEPTGMYQAPGSDRWYLVEKAGRVRTFSNSNNTSTVRTFVDIRGTVDSEPNEMGLLGLAFHPDWQSNRTAYLSFNMISNGARWSVLSRLRSTDGGSTLDTSTHEIVFSIQQPFENHNGGQISFGPDGFLYMGLGDGGSANDPNGNGQNTNTVLGSLMRIDVDNPSGGREYGIPSDNPFAFGGGREEIYAWGLRNPWRFSWDTDSGDLWLADVGQDAWEEVNIIQRGGNYGWRLKEGNACFGAPFPCNNLGVIDPVATYGHNLGRSITGGYVYRGDDIPGLQGAYIYGDIVSGRIWGLFPTSSGFEDRVLLESGIAMATFAQDRQGEIYVPSFSSGSIYKLVSSGGTGNDDFPQFLSDTGCFDPGDPRLPGAGMIPYDVGSPLWSDGAEKERFMAVPSGSRIEMEPDGDFAFPVGTVLAKTFFLHGRRVETRLLMRHPDGGWGGYAYRWNGSQTDAELLPSSEVVNVQGTEWRIPSRADCTACHTDAAGIALGPEFLQLNNEMIYASTKRRANQMDTLVHIGLFSNLVDGTLDTGALPRLSGLDDDSTSVEDRARSYLHSNCSNCHRPGGPGRSDADMRFLVGFGSQDICNEVPENALGLTNPRLIRPGDPEDSTIVHRMAALDASRMPALGSVVVDEDAVGLMSDWIADLGSCP